MTTVTFPFLFATNIKHLRKPFRPFIKSSKFPKIFIYTLTSNLRLNSRGAYIDLSSSQHGLRPFMLWVRHEEFLSCPFITSIRSELLKILCCFLALVIHSPKLIIILFGSCLTIHAFNLNFKSLFQFLRQSCSRIS